MNRQTLKEAQRRITILRGICEKYPGFGDILEHGIKQFVEWWQEEEAPKTWGKDGIDDQGRTKGYAVTAECGCQRFYCPKHHPLTGTEPDPLANTCPHLATGVLDSFIRHSPATKVLLHVIIKWPSKFVASQPSPPQ